jgi:CRP-like cAMP-binding protein
MSILDTRVIDMFGLPVNDPSRVELVIADHLDWSEDEGEHLLLLQEKINAYLRFIESGEILTVIPKAAGRRPVILIYGKYALSARAEWFVKRATAQLIGAGVDLAFSMKG